MALAPWNVLAAGKIRTDEEEEQRRKTGEKGTSATSLQVPSVVIDAFLPVPGRDYGFGWERTEDQRKVCKALEEVAKQVGTKSIQAGES